MAVAIFAAACSPTGDSSSAGDAIAAFDPEEVEESFASLHEHVREGPEELRAAALVRLGDEDANVHYAALYALSLTAIPGDSVDALRPYLSSDDVNERFLAAGSLLVRGEREAIATLIGLLDDERPLAYRDPPRAAWQLARAALLAFVEGDAHGLGEAESFEQVSATRPAWEQWWDANGSAVQWVADGSYYRSSP